MTITLYPNKNIQRKKLKCCLLSDETLITLPAHCLFFLHPPELQAALQVTHQTDGEKVISYLKCPTD